MDPTTPPRAFADLSVAGVYRRCLDDFYVEELPAVLPTGAGEHLLVHVEKRGINSAAVADDLARAFGVAQVDVSFAGMKDRNAVTRQWFSVRTPHDAARVVSMSAHWRVLESARHQRKLRRGDLSGNRFRIRIRELSGDRAVLQERCALVRAGVPNYFGEQRFGRDGANVGRARSWVCSRRRPAISAFQKGLHLSTARALLFNAVLARRVEGGCWNASIDGDVTADALPTGPLWGRGRAQATGAARTIEVDALAPYDEWLDPLEHLGLEQQRREFVLRPVQFDWQFTGDELELGFDLGPGQYATALLRELGSLTNAAAQAAA